MQLSSGRWCGDWKRALHRQGCMFPPAGGVFFCCVFISLFCVSLLVMVFRKSKTAVSKSLCSQTEPSKKDVPVQTPSCAECLSYQWY